MNNQQQQHAIELLNLAEDALSHASLDAIGDVVEHTQDRRDHMRVQIIAFLKSLGDRQAKAIKGKRLVHPPRGFNQNRVSDLLVALMANVEDAFLESGAEPGFDYSRLDLMKAATPFVVSMFGEKRLPPMEIVTEWSELDNCQPGSKS